MAKIQLPPNAARLLAGAFAELLVPTTKAPAFIVGEDYNWDPIPEIGPLGVVTCQSEYRTTVGAISANASLMVYGNLSARSRLVENGAYTVSPVQFAVFTWKKHHAANTAALMRAIAERSGHLLEVNSSLF